METRRFFLAGLLVTGAAACWAASASQNQEVRPPQQHPSEERGQGEGPNLPNPEKKILEENDKDMKKKVQRLYELATELKEQVDKTDSSKVFSLDLMKKAEEIERLARDIKNRSKG